ncbi:Rieske (2Fe-2S) protein [Caulobacter sp. D4A]|uniref:aromatic ring-hydroxylating oxygenase subunit alpha n=1 Tax=unclassified Caulobacter TaxID=2648921 RepID=UPI000D73B5E5|nr:MULTISPECIES: Rieske 2Fe-2S domain-containing protein [unclassified Caulobacter]PXA90777.1 Rieske (2Fe-2S) protein [Caulobacter sp. D4A]PXA94233.1 Rieske (2Fe-2S) protein [Caulobacter sp. D5]
MTPQVDALYRCYWHLVAHRSEVAEPGAWLRLDWAFGDLLVFNDDGEIGAFDNVCPHRGARFFVGDHGVGPMLCPYHGWRYGGGALKPALAKSFDPEVLAAQTIGRYRTAWCGDFLFVGVEPEQDLADQLGGAAVQLETVSRLITRRRDFHALPFECDWRVAVENALETYHVNLIHGETLASLAMVEKSLVVDGPNLTWEGEVTDKRTLRGLSALGRYFDAAEAYQGYWTIHVFPFAMISSTFGYSYAVQTYFPARDARRTHFCTRLLDGRVRPGAERAVEAFLDSSAEMNRRIFEEDRQICERVSPAYDLEKPQRAFARSEERLRLLHERLSAMKNPLS